MSGICRHARRGDFDWLSVKCLGTWEALVRHEPSCRACHLLWSLLLARQMRSEPCGSGTKRCRMLISSTAVVQMPV